MIKGSEHTYSIFSFAQKKDGTYTCFLWMKNSRRIHKKVVSVVMSAEETYAKRWKTDSISLIVHL